MKPYLREKVPVSISDIPETTSYEAGYLVTKNAGWRNKRPVIQTNAWAVCNAIFTVPTGASLKAMEKLI